MSVYQDNGYKNRMDYLQSLASNYEISLTTVLALADMLGKGEDFDGLLTELEDFMEMGDLDLEE